MTRRALEDLGARRQDAGPLQELLRARHVLLALQPAAGHHAEVARGQVRQASPSSPRPTSRVLKAGYNYGETTEVFHDALRGAAGEARARAPTATSPATRRSRSAWSPPAGAAGLPLFLGAYPITPASDILHELSTLQELRRHHLPGRGRDRRDRARRSAPLTAARSASPRPAARASRSRARRWPGGHDRAAAGHRRHPARRPVDRPADQDRAGRPAAGDVRPQRRVAGAGDRGRRRPADCFDVALEACRIARAST